MSHASAATVRALAIGVMLLGLITLAGWAWNIDVFKRVLPGLVSMKANAAAGFVFLGAGLLLLGLRQARVAARVLAGLTLLLGLVTLAEYAFGRDFLLDQFLFIETESPAHAHHPGRMSVIAAGNFVLLGGGLLLMTFSCCWRMVQSMALGASVLSLLTFGAYMFGDLTPRIGSSPAMAVHTTIGFLMLSAGMLLATQDQGVLPRLRGKIPVIALAGSLVMLLFSFGTTVYGIQQRQEASAWVEHAHSDLLSLAHVSSHLHQFGERIRAFIYTGNETSLQSANNVRSELLGHWREIHAEMTHEPGQRQRTDALTQMLQRRFELADESVRLRREKGEAAVLAMLSHGEIDRLVVSIDQALEAMQETERALLAERQKTALTRNSAGIITLGVTMALSFGLILATFSALLREIAQRKQSEMALRTNEEQMRIFIEHTPVAVAMLDTNLCYMAASQRWLADYGLDGQDLHGRSHYEIFPEITERWKQIHRRCLGGAVERADEDPFMRADGSLHWLRWEVRPWHYPSGAVGGLIFFSEDITEHKRVDDELDQHRHHLEELINQRTHDLSLAKDMAERASKAKSEFLGRMSHELRTPMNAILGFAQLLEADRLNAEQLEFVHEIHQAGDHLLELINELLDLSRIESGRLETVVQAVALGPITEQAIALVKPLLDSMQLSLHLQCEPDIMLLADPTRLKQVLVNLLSNAAKYNRSGGSIHIHCQQSGQERMRISVTDTGGGIAAENMKRLFTAFDRLGASELTAIEGSGIGLALSKNLIELMGGEIGVESTEGQGSTFWIELLSTHQPVAAVASGTGMLPEENLGKCNVLYIEDNASNLKVVQAMLRHQPNLTLLAAANGEYGLELAQRHLPDLILLDIHLPGMDGFAVLKELQSHPETRSIPVVALSADAMPLDVEKGLAAGFSRYLTKPVKAQEIMDVVSSVTVGKA